MSTGRSWKVGKVNIGAALSHLIPFVEMEGPVRSILFGSHVLYRAKVVRAKAKYDGLNQGTVLLVHCCTRKPTRYVR